MTTLPKSDSGKRPREESHSEPAATLFPPAEGARGERFVPLAAEDVDLSKLRAKLIAFYLPQFHRIPENDEWWGEGFTEWVNVRKALPSFTGHYQPRIPGDLGYYDLSDVDVQRRQIAIARKYGVHGFCFYYYWFGGKRLLERPLDQFLQSSDLDFPFCICWANENWTRRWDGADHDILIAQRYSKADYAAFIRDVAPVLLDPRYIRIEGKPVLAVYRLNLLPSPDRATEIWREESARLGVGEIHLLAIQSNEIRDPRSYGCDAAVEFPPHNCIVPATLVHKSRLGHLNPRFHGNVYDYRVAAQVMLDQPVPDYVKFKTVMLAWDNTARRQNTADLFINASPGAYERWLRRAIDYTCAHLPDDKHFLFINAWNEWGEGTYLEPDQTYGYAFLQATANAVRIVPASGDPNPRELLQRHQVDVEGPLRYEAAPNEQVSQPPTTFAAVSAEHDAVKDTMRRKLMRFVRRLGGALFPSGGIARDAVSSVYRVFEISSEQGAVSLARKIANHFIRTIAYQVRLWNNQPDNRALQRPGADDTAFAYRPLISIIMPVYNSHLRWLRAAIQSVRAQTYPNWELCIADDASTNARIRPFLEKMVRLEPRIKVTFRPENGHISRASNSALEMATGQFVCTLDHDDILYPHALLEVVRRLNTPPQLDVIYSDSDLIFLGWRMRPFFKPDWSSELFESNNYLNHLTVLRKSLVDAVGGFRPGFEGSQDYDLYLRVVGRTSPDRIGHIPEVLYGWRAAPGSAAFGLDAKPYAMAAGRRALEEALAADQLVFAIEPGIMRNTFHVRRRIPGHPLVSIIVAAGNNPGMLRPCLDSIVQNGGYDNVEILAASRDQHQFPSGLLVRPLDWENEDDCPEMRNYAAQRAQGEYLCFVSPAIRLSTPGSMELLLEQAQRPAIGLVSSKILDGCSRVYSAGMTLLAGQDMYAHLLRGRSDDLRHYFLNTPRNCLGLSEAFCLVAREQFEAAGAYSEDFGCIELSHVDMCLRLHAQGYRHVYLPFVTVQYEIPAQSRPDRRAADIFRARWGPYLRRDPYYPAQLSTTRSDFSV